MMNEYVKNLFKVIESYEIREQGTFGTLKGIKDNAPDEVKKAYEEIKRISDEAKAKGDKIF